MRCKLLSKEKLETKERLKEIERKSTLMKEDLDRKNHVLMDDIRTLSREKNNFTCWVESFNSDVQAHGKWMNALKEQRLHVIRSFNSVFPIGNVWKLIVNITDFHGVGLDRFRDRGVKKILCYPKISLPNKLFKS